MSTGTTREQKIELVAKAIASTFPKTMRNYDIGKDELIPCTWEEWDNLSHTIYRRYAESALRVIEELGQ